MTWWLSDTARLREEIEGIKTLTDGSQNIRLRGWRPLGDDINLAVDVEVLVRDEWVPLTLSYPSLFPATAPSVKSKDGKRLSAHQYVGGELCLEYRPDNWQPEFTGAMMLESAERLLLGEAVPDAPPLPTAHAQSVGQQYRQESYRLVLTAAAKTTMAALPHGSVTKGSLSEHVIEGSIQTFQVLSRVLRVGEGDDNWKDATLVHGNLQQTSFVRVAGEEPVAFDSYDDLCSRLRALGHEDVCEILEKPRSHAVVFVTDLDVFAWWKYAGDSGPQIVGYTTLDISGEAEVRLPESYQALKDRKVGLIGCGSLGTKVAESLVRSGVGSMMLVDDDIILPGNLVRQDYSGEFIGAHKTEALRKQLRRINPAVSVTSRRVRVGGQESAETTSSVLEDLGKCDLIIDATADPVAYNLLAQASVVSKVPMVWGEVLAGGIGGFVSRSRPGLDPAPVLVRRTLATWCETMAVRWPPEGTRAYEAIVEGKPMIADNGDVAVIAGHMARFALDLLTAPGRSKFPYSLYAIGLAAEWAFKEPFEVTPIVMDGAPGWNVVQEAPSAETFKEAIELLGTILPKQTGSDAVDSAA